MWPLLLDQWGGWREKYSLPPCPFLEYLAKEGEKGGGERVRIPRVTPLLYALSPLALPPPPSLPPSVCWGGNISLFSSLLFLREDPSISSLLNLSPPLPPPPSLLRFVAGVGEEGGEKGGRKGGYVFVSFGSMAELSLSPSHFSPSSSSSSPSSPSSTPPKPPIIEKLFDFLIFLFELCEMNALFRISLSFWEEFRKVVERRGWKEEKGEEGEKERGRKRKRDNEDHFKGEEKKKKRENERNISTSLPSPSPSPLLSLPSSSLSPSPSPFITFTKGGVRVGVVGGYMLEGWLMGGRGGGGGGREREREEGEGGGEGEGRGCVCVIHHGGGGTCTSALSVGVPQVSLFFFFFFFFFFIPL